MKTIAIYIASVLLVGCQASQRNANIPQHAQSLSTATVSQSETGTNSGRTTSTRWMDDGPSVTQKNDLWSSIGSELKMGIPDNYRIREQKQKYLSNKSYLHDVTLRAEPYMYWISAQVKKRNMPMELVLLPIVESAFDPHATSSSNAAGIWQIVPSTGRNYGLKQTKAYDGRRDVVASTNAALDLMQRLNKMFDGDWLLTIAAYNSGEGRVMNAIKSNKARGKPTNFWALSLPQETKIYVPKMLALSDILKNSQKYGVRFPGSDESRALARVNVSNPVAMTQIAQTTGLPLSKVKAFNAGVRSANIGESGPQYVLVPKKHAEKLRTSLASGEINTVQSELVSNNFSAPGGKYYTIRTGDTLSAIASRSGVSTKDLQSWNNLRGVKLKPGQKLTISSSLALADNDSVTYRVRKGDSLSSIAKRHNVNIKDVTRWNDGTDKLKPGDQLTLFIDNDDKPET